MAPLLDLMVPGLVLEGQMEELTLEMQRYPGRWRPHLFE
jgi:hypothetical protein